MKIRLNEMKENLDLIRLCKIVDQGSAYTRLSELTNHDGRIRGQGYDGIVGMNRQRRGMTAWNADNKNTSISLDIRTNSVVFEQVGKFNSIQSLGEEFDLVRFCWKRKLS
jgi:hypothetical protein